MLNEHDIKDMTPPEGFKTAPVPKPNWSGRFKRWWDTVAEAMNLRTPFVNADREAQSKNNKNIP